MTKKNIKPGEMSPELRDHLAKLEAKRLAEVENPEYMCPDCQDKLRGACGECDGSCGDCGEDIEQYANGAFMLIQNTLELALLAQRYGKESENTVFKGRVAKLEDKLTGMLEHMSSMLEIDGPVGDDEIDSNPAN